MRKGTWIRGAFAMAVAAGLWASPVAAQQKLSVGLASTNYFGYTQIYAAEELGLFKASGVTVDAIPFRGAGAAQEALAAGSIDVFNASPYGAVIAIDKGVKQKIVASNLFDKPIGTKVIVLPGSSAQSLKDLEGKKFGITSTGSGTQISAMQVMKAGNVKMQVIPVGDGLVGALNSKQVDVIAIWGTISYRLLANNEARMLADLGVGEPNIPNVWVASNEAMSGKGPEIKGFLVGMAKAYDKMKQDPKYGKDIIKRYTQETDDRAVDMAYDEFIKFGNPDGRIDRVAFDNTLAIAETIGAKIAPNAYDRTISTQFIPVSGH